MFINTLEELKKILLGTVQGDHFFWDVGEVTFPPRQQPESLAD